MQDVGDSWLQLVVTALLRTGDGESRKRKLPQLDAEDLGGANLREAASGAANGEESKSGEPDRGDVEVKCPCVKCKEVVGIKQTLSAGRTGRVCKPCYNSQRALTEHFKKRGKLEEWQRMAAEKKRKLIVDNKGTTFGRGKQRQLTLSEDVRGSECEVHGISRPKVVIDDHVAQKSVRQYTNKKEQLALGCRGFSSL